MPEILHPLKLKPTSIINLDTGEADNFDEFYANVRELITFVRDWANENIEQNFDDIVQKLNGLVDKRGKPKKVQPAEAARQIGYLTNKLPKTIKEQYRINRIAGDALMRAVTSNSKNLKTKNKQLPKAGHKISLSAADKQMATISVDDESNTLTMWFRCWHADYLLEFNVPYFTSQLENITKWCLPDVQYLRDGWDEQGNKKYESEPTFIFNVKEQVGKSNGNLFAGADLNKANNEPFRAVVTNERGARIAEYKPNGRIKQAWGKVDRRSDEVRNISKKARQYERLGLDDRAEALWVEKRRTQAKNTEAKKRVSQQGAADLFKKLRKHELSVFRMEDLSWVHGQEYGGRWNHSDQQDYLEDQALKQGFKVEKVNPKNTSQKCYKCHTKLIHNRKNRTVWCVECKHELDRDFNAAMNVARDLNELKKQRLKKLKKNSKSSNKNTPNNETSVIGADCSSVSNTVKGSHDLHGFVGKQVSSNRDNSNILSKL